MPPHKKFFGLNRKVVIIISVVISVAILALIVGLAAGLSHRSRWAPQADAPWKILTITKS